MMVKANQMPACFRNKCEMADVFSAPESPAIYTVINAFIENESLAENPAYSDMQRRHLEDTGLNKLPVRTLMRMKRIFHEYKVFIIEKNR